MKPSQNQFRKWIFISLILLLVLFTFCLFSGIFTSIPTRTAEIYGTPNPGLNPQKLYYQSIILLLSEEQLTTPGVPSGEELIFPIQAGDTLQEILSGLVKLDLVRHRSAFRAYLIYTGIDTRIQPGDYYLSPAMTEVEIAARLSNPVPLKTTVSILAGWRAEEIAESFQDLGLTTSPEAFLENMAFFPDLTVADLEFHQSGIQARLDGYHDFYIKPDRNSNRVIMMAWCAPQW